MITHTLQVTLRGSDSSKVSQPTTWGTPHSRGILCVCLRARGIAASGAVGDDRTGWEILCSELEVGLGKAPSSRPHSQVSAAEVPVAGPSGRGFQNSHALFSPGSAARLRGSCGSCGLRALRPRLPGEARAPQTARAQEDDHTCGVKASARCSASAHPLRGLQGGSLGLKGSDGGIGRLSVLVYI